MNIGVIAALSKEAQLICASLQNVKESQEAGNHIWQGDIFGNQVFVTVSGMGMVNAAAATQFLITKHNIEAVINSGIAGNLTPGLCINSIVIAKNLFPLQTDTKLIAESFPNFEYFGTDRDFVNAAKIVAKELNVNAIVGNVASGNRFVNTPDQIAEVKNTVEGFGETVNAVEMEGAAVAQICAKNSVKCLVVRSMSDNCDEEYSQFSEDNFSIEQYAKTAANFVVELIKKIEC